MAEFNLIVITVLLILGLGVFMSNWECHAKADALGYACNYKPIQGCVLIKPDGKRVLLQQLRDYSD